MKNSKTYVVHYCKNPKCNNVWVDVDLTNANKRPPRWKYCKECCEKLGVENPEFPPKRSDAEKRIERLKKYQFKEKK